MLTYDEIVNIEFPKGAFGGYKSDSVDDYIDDVAATVKELLEQIDSLNKKVETLDAEIQEYKKTESSLHAALVIAQETAQKLIQESTQKAGSTVKAAEEKAAVIIAEAEAKAKELVSSSSSESSELIKKTKERAIEILREALAKANSITHKAKENCAAEEAKFEDLKKKVNDFRSSMLLLYRSHVELLNEMRAEPSKPIENETITKDVQEEAETIEETVVSEPVQEVVEQIEEVEESVDEAAIESPELVEEVEESDFDEVVEDAVVDQPSFEVVIPDDELDTSSIDVSADSDEGIEEIDLSKISFNDFSDSSDDDSPIDFELLNNQ